MSCETAARLRTLYLCDELSATERTALEAHLATCAMCAEELARERTLLQALSTMPRLEPDLRLLEQCRSQLGETLDDLPGPARPRWFAFLHSASGLAGHPALAAALLLLLGVAMGYGVPHLLQQRAEDDPIVPVVTVRPQLSETELLQAQVEGIHWLDTSADGGPRVGIQLAAERPLVLEGSPDDDAVKLVLMRLARSFEHADPGLRMESLSVLGAERDDVQVRQTLCEVARNDRNPAIRLHALEVLRGLEQDDAVRQTLLDRLLHDENPGVRIEAINSLRALLERSPEQRDPRLLEVFRDRMQRDPNRYIRMQSAAALQGIGPREVY
ncbi:MAG: HEAT repeat domain-containing protein [Firmicutes bacterium]|nr:HEAT repeat domain-containing protein [Bacillota bacterium]